MLNQRIESIFFYPDNELYGGHPIKDNLVDYQIIKLQLDNVELDGWFVSPNYLPPQGTIIHFHGNAANITNHWSFVDWIPHEGFNLFTFDYRGFGKSTGTPGFDGVYHDCIKAINYVQKNDKTDNIILLGQSIGGAFCLNAASDSIENNLLKSNKLKGLIIDSSFDSFIEIAKSKIPFLPPRLFSKLITDRFNPGLAASKLIGIPKLFIHGRKDNVVPFNRGKKLYEKSSEPKNLLEIPQGKHLSIFKSRKKEYMSEVIKFLNNCIKETSVFKIANAISIIMEHNKKPQNDNKYLITNEAIFRIIKSDRESDRERINQYIKEHQILIETHNKMYGTII